MQIVFAEAQLKHHPSGFLVRGQRQPCPEVPARAMVLKEAAESHGHRLVVPESYGFGPRAAVHTPRYLRFLETAHDRWQALPGTSPEVIPNVHPGGHGNGYPESVVREAASLPAGMVGCFAYDQTALVERYVPGMDVAVSVLDLGKGPQALPPVEIVPRNGVYDYAARYTAGRTTWHAPARLDAATTARVTEVALAAHTALGLRDVSRVDLIVDAGGDPHVLEVNVSPGMTETSLLPLAIQAAGLDFGRVLGTLVTRAAARR